MAKKTKDDNEDLVYSSKLDKVDVASCMLALKWYEVKPEYLKLIPKNVGYGYKMEPIYLNQYVLRTLG